MDYKDYLLKAEGQFKLVRDTMCDLCRKIERGENWQFGLPWLCIDHARELGVLW